MKSSEIAVSATSPQRGLTAYLPAQLRGVFSALLLLGS
jgi:hypothetical protein